MDGVQRLISGPHSIRRARKRGGSALILSAALFLFFVLSGCSSKIVDLTRVSDHPELLPQTAFPFGRTSLTPETAEALNELGLGKSRLSNFEKLVKLQEETNTDPSPEYLLAFCELGYNEAAEIEKTDPDYAGEIYTAVLLNSYRYLFDPAFDDERNPLDHHYRDAASYYNKSAERLLRRIFRDTEAGGEGTPAPGDVLTFKSGVKEIRIRCQMQKSLWKPEEIGPLQFSSDYKVDGLDVHYTREGLGVPVIVSRKRSGRREEVLYPETLSFPMTLFLRPVIREKKEFESDGESDGVTNLRLEFYDPLFQKKAEAGNIGFSLAYDLTTPLSYNFIDPSVNELGTLGLTRPEAFFTSEDGDENGRTLAGFYMIAPPDPNKIPVVLVHGLWSTPMTWLAMVGAFQNDPEIWDHYQFWFWCYPTGLPWWVSAAELRSDLGKMYTFLDPDGTNPNYQNSVIIGYSMGGLIADLQVCGSGNEVWNLVSDDPFDPTQFKNPEAVHDIFFFEPNPNLTRLITIAAPFKGSDSVNTFVQWFADKVIVPPENFSKMSKILNAAGRRGRKKDSLLEVKNSVESMSPGSPFFEALDQLPMQEGTAFNNIIGMTESGLIFKKTEGDKIVRYESAHRSDAESEFAVDAYHTYVHTNPAAIHETERILKEHLALQKGAARTARKEADIPIFSY